MDIYINIDDVASSNIKKVKYEAHVKNNDMRDFNQVKGVLTIMYSNDAIYNYLDVPLITVGNLMIHDSIGKSVASLVKPMFESEKVGP